MAAVLDSETIVEALADLEGWEFSEHAIAKEFVFGSFPEAMSFMIRVGFVAEHQNHHPEMTNVYNRVRIRLTTHDAENQVTQRDLDVAEAIERFNWAN